MHVQCKAYNLACIEHFIEAKTHGFINDIKTVNMYNMRLSNSSAKNIYHKTPFMVKHCTVFATYYMQEIFLGNLNIS